MRFPWRNRKKQPPTPAVKSTVLGFPVAVLQEQGRREKQEDSYLLVNHQDVIQQRKKGLLILVVDGMGGMADGKLAGETVVSSLMAAFSREAPLEDPADWLENQMDQANTQVIQRLDGKGGSTAVCCVIHGEKLWFASVGDSCLYLLRDGELNRLNRPQTVMHRELWNQLLRGSTDPKEARTHPEAPALTGFLGMKGLSDVDLLRKPLPLKESDVLLACSDGVGGVLTEQDLCYCMSQSTPRDICEALRQRVVSKEKPYQDNYTAVVIQCTY